MRTPKVNPYQLKVKNKTSKKKFKKGISFVFILVDLYCFTIQLSIQYCSNDSED